MDQRRELGKYLASTQAFSRVLDHVLTRSMTMAASSTSSFHQTGKLMSLSHRIQTAYPRLSSFSSSRTKHAPNTRKHTEEEDTNAKTKAHESNREARFSVRTCYNNKSSRLASLSSNSGRLLKGLNDPN